MTTTDPSGANGSKGMNSSKGSKPHVDISLATSANELNAVPTLVKQITTQAEPVSESSYEARLKLLATARSLVQALETQREMVLKHTWAQPAANAAITTLYQVGVFDVMARQNKPTTVMEFATATHADPALLNKLSPLWVLGVVQLIESKQPGCCVTSALWATLKRQDPSDSNKYVTTNFAKALCLPMIGDAYPCCVGGGIHSALNHFHDFSRDHDYQMVESSTDTPLQYAEKAGLDLFQWLQKIGLGPPFNRLMAGYHRGRPSWMDPGFYPVQERLVEEADTSTDAPFLVDIGGNLGHDLVEVRLKHPKTPGRLILEDLPVVIDQIQELNPSIERAEYDFHMEQPHKGTRAYYMHSVLHDWPDEVCASILKNVTAAMKPGYSRLLINENVIPDTGADWQATALDIMMLTSFSSRERTMEDWLQLLEPAGLKVTNVWGGGNGTESLIECELA